MTVRGAGFTQEIEDRGCGLVTVFRMPGGVTAPHGRPRSEKRFT